MIVLHHVLIKDLTGSAVEGIHIAALRPERMKVILRRGPSRDKRG